MLICKDQTAEEPVEVNYLIPNYWRNTSCIEKNIYLLVSKEIEHLLILISYINSNILVEITGIFFRQGQIMFDRNCCTTY